VYFIALRRLNHICGRYISVMLFSCFWMKHSFFGNPWPSDVPLIMWADF
jgi:hypothetical protein